MADSVQVGALVVRLIADAKQLEGALQKGGADLRKFGNEADKANKKVQKSADDMAKNIVNVVSRLAGVVAAFVSVNAIISQFNKTISDVTALDHLSQVTGASVERLSELRNISLATGVAFETVSRAFEQFGARMTESLASPTSKGSQALRALSIDVRDAQGNIRQLDELLPELADRFGQFANGSNKAALASALFGEEAGPKMLALLNKGKAGLEELRRTLGSTFSGADAETVRNYKEAIAKLQIELERAFNPALMEGAKILTELMNKISEYVRRVNDATAANARDSQAARDAATAYNTASEALKKLADERQFLQEAVEAGGPHVERDRKALASVTDEYTRQANEVNRLGAALAMLRSQQASGALKADPNAPGNQLPQAPAMDPFALEKAQIALDQIMERLSGQRDIFDSINLSWEEHARVVTQAMDAIGKANEQRHRRDATLHRLQQTMRRQEQEGMLQTASAAASAISALWPKQKGAAIAAAVINTGVAITRALAGPPGPPWTFAIAALTAVQGAAQIAAIRSTDESGNGGGTPGVAAAAPVEPTADFGRSLTINGVDPGALFSGGQVRGLIEMINEEVRNGATLISSGRLAA